MNTENSLKDPLWHRNIGLIQYTDRIVYTTETG